MSCWIRLVVRETGQVIYNNYADGFNFSGGVMASLGPGSYTISCQVLDYGSDANGNNPYGQGSVLYERAYLHGLVLKR